MQKDLPGPTATDKLLIALAFAFVIWVLFLTPLKAEGPVRAEMEACNSKACDDVRDLTPYGGLSLFECNMAILQAAQKWVADNKPPGWFVKKTRCTTSPAQASL